jgi:membrane-associated phospholipid phosphatase
MTTQDGIGAMADEPNTVKVEDGAQATDLVVSPRRAALRAYRGEIVFGATLAIYAVLALLAHNYAYFSWDLGLARGIQSIATPGFRTLMIWVSVLGNGWAPTTLVAAVGLGFVLARLRVEGLICMVGVATGAGVNRLFKALVDRPRPSQPLVQVAFDVSHESFPSGHVVFFIEFFGFLLFVSFVLLRAGLLRRIALGIFGMFIALIGLSRVYLGAHWPSDVVGAYLAGGIWLMLMIEGYRRLKEKERS